MTAIGATDNDGALEASNETEENILKLLKNAESQSQTAYAAKKINTGVTDFIFDDDSEKTSVSGDADEE